MKKKDLLNRIEQLEADVRQLQADNAQPVKHLGMTSNGIRFSPWLDIPSTGTIPLSNERAVDDELLGMVGSRWGLND